MRFLKIAVNEGMRSTDLRISLTRLNLLTICMISRFLMFNACSAVIPRCKSVDTLWYNKYRIDLL